MNRENGVHKDYAKQKDRMDCCAGREALTLFEN